MHGKKIMGIIPELWVPPWFIKCESYIHGTDVREKKQM